MLVGLLIVAVGLLGYSALMYQLLRNGGCGQLESFVGSLLCAIMILLASSLGLWLIQAQL